MRSLRAEVGDRAPFLRWSFLRFALGQHTVAETGQVGDGREEALLAHVTAHAEAGDIDATIRVIDDFARTESFLMNVGDEKGEILDLAIDRAQPLCLLELGAYCGYSALRAARAMPAEAVLVSVEASAANVSIARQVIQHAGAADRVTVLQGRIGDDGATLDRLRSEHGFDTGTLDFVFLDHAKTDYLPDLQRIVAAGWLHTGSVVVADNIRTPGVPDYLAYMRSEQGRRWRTVEHDTHVEYQSVLRDVVLESEYIG